MRRKITADLFKRLERLYTGLVCDVLDDQLGFGNNRYMMSYEIRALRWGAIVAGRAATALAAPVHREPADPYAKEIQFIDTLSPGDVVVMTQSGAFQAGLWGGLLSTRAQKRGACGAVIDGITRDTREIIRMGFPTFIRGIAPGDSKGRVEVIEIHVPIQCAGASVNPGDVVFGDHDGVVVIPQEIAVDIVRLAEEKQAKEKKFQSELKRGVSLSKLFKKYGIL